MRHLLRVASLLAVVSAVASSVAAQVPQTVLFPGLEGQPLLDAVRAAYTPDSTRGYDIAPSGLRLAVVR